MRTLGLACVALVFGGCVDHIRPYKKKRRHYEQPVQQPSLDSARASGSLFDPRGLGATLFTDTRARNVNDKVVIRIDEQATAQRDTATETGREDTVSSQLDALLGFMKAVDEDHSQFDRSNALSLATKMDFKGAGKTSRNDKLQAIVPAIVMKRLQNGLLFVEGHRAIMVNREEHHFYISGLVSPEDIDGDGVVSSTRLADAQIEFSGRGDLSAAANKGWFSRFLDVVWPF